MERSIPVDGREELTKLFGTYDRNLKEIKKATGVDVTVRNGDIHIRGTRSTSIAITTRTTARPVRSGTSPGPSSVTGCR